MSRAGSVKSIIESLQKLYPKQLADSKWDNTGLLVDAMCDLPGSAAVANQVDKLPRVLLTIDLTGSVASEAIDQNSDLVIAYHPFIFSGIKAIKADNPQHRSLVRLLRAGISVYSPHTAIDASTRGVNDWLADGISSWGQNQIRRTTIEPISPGVAGHENAGYGRLVQLEKPIMLSDLLNQIKSHLSLSTVQLVRADRHKTTPISSVAICAGSGGSVLSGVEADLWFTGELGHHEMLFLRESGTSAIVCGHSNTERGFLPQLRDQLAKQLTKDGHKAHISIAATDRDPIEYI